MAVSFLLVGVTLYLLFRHVDRRTAAAPVVYLAVGVHGDVPPQAGAGAGARGPAHTIRSAALVIAM